MHTRQHRPLLFYIQQRIMKQSLIKYSEDPEKALTVISHDLSTMRAHTHTQMHPYAVRVMGVLPPATC